MEIEETRTGGVIQSLPVYPELPLSFAQYERLSYGEKERFSLLTKDYDEVKKAFNAYLDRIGYHYKYFGSYIDEIKSLHKAAKELYFEKAAEEIAGKIKEQGIDVGDYTKVDTKQLVEIFTDYAEKLEDITSFVSAIFDRMGIEVDIDAKYPYICKIRDKICLFIRR